MREAKANLWTDHDQIDAGHKGVDDLCGLITWVIDEGPPFERCTHLESR